MPPLDVDMNPICSEVERSDARDCLEMGGCWNERRQSGSCGGLLAEDGDGVVGKIDDA